MPELSLENSTMMHGGGLGHGRRREQPGNPKGGTLRSVSVHHPRGSPKRVLVSSWLLGELG